MFPLILRRSGTALAAVPLFFSLSAFADDYKALNITSCAGVPVTWLKPSGIAADNSIVGSFGEGQSRTHGFLYRRGECTLLDVPGIYVFEANGINTARHIVGGLSDSGGQHGFLLKDEQFTIIDYPDASTHATTLNGINNRGHIVGTFTTQGGSIHGFVYAGGSFTEIYYPDSVSTWAQGINQAGVVVGFYKTSWHGGKTQGFRFKDGRYETLNHPKGPDDTSLYGINSDGEIVGYYYDAIQNRHIGFLFSEGSFNRLRFPGPNGMITRPLGINRSGYVVGQYAPSFDPRERGFFWTWE